jgi:hypothetical protein
VLETTGRSTPALLARISTGERLAGFTYGTIVVLSVLVAEAPQSTKPGTIAEVVAATCFTFWLAHVYAHSLGHSLTHRSHFSVAALREIGVREASILEAGVPPLVALLLGAAGILGGEAAVWLAFALGLGVLAVQGVVYARIERLGRTSAIVVVTLNIGLGLLLALLKIVLAH